MMNTVVNAFQQNHFWYFTNNCECIELGHRWANINIVGLVPLHAHMHQHYTQSGNTALHWAVHQEHEDIVDLLLKANADTDLPEKVIYTYQTQQSCDLNEV